MVLDGNIEILKIIYRTKSLITKSKRSSKSKNRADSKFDTNESSLINPIQVFNTKKSQYYGNKKLS